MFSKYKLAFLAALFNTIGSFLVRDIEEVLKYFNLPYVFTEISSGIGLTVVFLMSPVYLVIAFLDGMMAGGCERSDMPNLRIFSGDAQEERIMFYLVVILLSFTYGLIVKKIFEKYKKKKRMRSFWVIISFSHILAMGTMGFFILAGSSC